MDRKISVGDQECLDLLREAQVAVAVVAASNPQWLDLWHRIQSHIEKRDSGTRTRWEQAEIYLGRITPLFLSQDRDGAIAELASMAENLSHHDDAYWKT